MIQSSFARRMALYFTVIVYISGMIGMNTSWRPWFIAMTPVSLLLSAGILLWWQPVHTHLTRAWAAGALLVGFLAEVIGVNTGLLFGDYQYGDALGVKIASTPLMIGINWLMVTLIVNELVWRVLPARTNLFAGALLGAAGCTLFDWFIEPGAIGLGYWTWAEVTPPLENYLGWFGVSFVISLSYARQMTPVLRNTAAPVILMLQILFFWAIR